MPNSSKAVDVVFVMTHPVQYWAPRFRDFAANASFDFRVVYEDLRGARGPALSAEFGRSYVWDTDLLGGYEWTALDEDAQPPPSIVGAVFRSWSLMRVAARKRPRLIVVQGMETTTQRILILLLRLLTVRVAIISSMTSPVSSTGRVSLRYFGLNALGIHVLASSPKAATRYVDGGLASERIWLVRNVIDVDRFAAAAEKSSRPDDIPATTWIAVFCGKLIPRKRVLDAVRAVELTQDWGLVVVGAGPDEPHIKSYVARHGLNERVRLAGFKNQSELPAYFRSAQALILPSAIEPFGLVVNEAFSCRTPAVVTDVCGAAYSLVVPGVTGFVTEVGNPEGIAAALTEIENDPETLSENAYALVSQDWSLRVHRLEFERALSGIARGAST